MIVLPQYRVLGNDGQEYGPVYDDQIRQWIAEGRLERKSPVKPPEANDWVFLESLPEFIEAFTASETAEKFSERRTIWRQWFCSCCSGSSATITIIDYV